MRLFFVNLLHVRRFSPIRSRTGVFGEWSGRGWDPFGRSVVWGTLLYVEWTWARVLAPSGRPAPRPFAAHSSRARSSMRDTPSRWHAFGNRFFNVNQKQAAEMAWKKSGILNESREVSKTSEPFSQNLKRLRLQTVGSILIVVVSFYVIIFSFFERATTFLSALLVIVLAICK